jgi:hypothetical protein
MLMHNDIDGMNNMRYANSRWRNAWHSRHGTFWDSNHSNIQTGSWFSSLHFISLIHKNHPDRALLVISPFHLPESQRLSFGNIANSLSIAYMMHCLLQMMISMLHTQVVLATGPGNPPAVRVWNATMGRFGSWPVQKPDLQTFGRPIPCPYLSTHGFRRVWADPSVAISGCAFRVSHLWSHSDVLMLNVKYWHWCVTVHFRHVGHLDVQNQHTHAPNHILKMSVCRASTERQQCVNDIWSCIFSNMSGTWLQASMKKDMAAFIGRYVRDILATSSGTVTTNFMYRATTKYSWAIYHIITVKTIYIDNNRHIVLWLTMMEGQQSLTLCWHSVWWCGREGIPICFADKGSQ